MQHLTFPQLLFSMSLWIITLLYYSQSLYSRKFAMQKRYFFFCIAVIVFSTFAYANLDFFHYKESYELIIQYKYNGFWEPFYHYLINVLPPYYYLWRLVIWGISTVIIVLIFKRIQAPPSLSCLCFVLILMTYFCVPRNTLGYVFLYFFVTFITKPTNNKFFSYAIAILGIYCSTFLHKSMPIYIIILFVSFLPMKKSTYLFSVIAFPFLYSTFDVFASYMEAFLTSGDSSFQSRGLYYLESENFSITNFNGYIKLFIERVPLLILLYLSIKQLLNNSIKDKTVEIFVRYAYWLIYISFLLFNQSTSSFLSVRFWDASLYPLAIAVPAIINMSKRHSLVLISFYWLIFANMYNFLYLLYKM